MIPMKDLEVGTLVKSHTGATLLIIDGDNLPNDYINDGKGILIVSYSNGESALVIAAGIYLEEVVSGVYESFLGRINQISVDQPGE